MNPLEQIAKTVTRPVEAVSKALNRPSAVGNRPFDPTHIVTAIRGGSLEEALEGRIVMTTGASSGIGAAAAKAIGAAGGEVILVARGLEKLEATAAEVAAAGGKAHIYPCDLSDTDAIVAMVDKVNADLGGVDILINNAGRSIRRSLALSYDRFHDYQRTMQLNYFAPLQLMLKVLPGMRERRYGRVINISSIGVLARAPRFGAYVASKAALDYLCDCWQAETHADNVHFTTVHMPLVRTPMISATTIYDRFPTLTPDDAADVIAKAIIHKPRRVSPPFGQFAAYADAVTPQIMDRVRSRAYQLFDDSAAAKGPGGSSDKPVSAQGRVFAEVTRGVHW